MNLVVTFTIENITTSTKFKVQVHDQNGNIYGKVFSIDSNIALRICNDWRNTPEKPNELAGQVTMTPFDLMDLILEDNYNALEIHSEGDV